MACQYETDHERLEGYRRDNRKLTRLLCQATAILAAHRLIPAGELAEWHAAHEEQDRRERERERAEAERKRTAEEREAYLKSVADRLGDQLSPDEIEAIRKFGS